MDIHHLQKTYNLDFEEVVSILKKHNITIQLPQLSDIPKSWIVLIEESLGLKPLNNEVEKSNRKEQAIRNEKKRAQPLQNKSVENTKVSIPAEDLETTYLEDNNSKNSNGSSYSYNHIKKSKNSNQRKAKQKPSKESKKKFYAYVKYVGPESDHAFIRIYKDINLITYENANLRDDQSYKLAEDCSKIKDGQIILVNIPNEKYKLASIVETSFIGTFVPGNHNTFVDWTSFNHPYLIVNVTFSKFEIEDEFVSVKMFYSSRNRIYCEEGYSKLNNEMLGPIVSNQFKTIILNNNVPHQALISAFRKIFTEKSFQDELKAKFIADAERKLYLESEDTLHLFIEKWSTIEPSLLSYDNMIDEDSKFIYFDLWFKNKLPLEFWGERLIDTCVQYQGFLGDNGDEKISLNYALSEDHLKKIESALPNYFNQELKINTLKTRQILKNLIDISNVAGKDTYYKKIDESLGEELKLELWLENEIEEFPKSLALDKFADLNIEKQAKVIEILQEAEIAEILQFVKSTKEGSHFGKLFNASKIKLLEVLNPVSFDIESDIKSIRELAWNTNDLWHFYNTPALVKEGLHNFKETANNPKNILIGHNIIDFDCPVLEKRGVKFREEILWDTYRIEALLSPDLKHYALVTKHNAKSDAELTLDLFINQILRILILPADRKNNFYKYLSKRLIIILEDLSDNLSFPWASEEILLKTRQQFYRPEANINKHIVEVLDFVSNSTAPLKLIIGPTSFKNQVLRHQNIFLLNSKDELDFRLLDKGAIEKNVKLDIYLKSVLLNFLIYCESNRIKPYWCNLPIPIRISLEKDECDGFTLVIPLTESSTKVEGVIFATADELVSNITELEEAEEIDVLIIQPELITVTQKKLLKDVDINDFKHLIEDNDFWLKFSGGQSYVSLTKKQCESFNIEISLDHTNFWIEKYQIAKYRVWANNNWEDILKVLPINHQKIISLNAKDFAKDQTVFVRANFSDHKKDQILRINPESIYRSRYWAFQKELVKQILNPKKSSILLIQNYSEVEILEDYFRSMGYYIPKRGASLARRLELLAENRDKSKLIIEQIDNIDKVVNANYLEELNIIIDSFNLAENFYISQNTNLLEQYYKKSVAIKQNPKEDGKDEIEIDGESESEEQNPNIFIGKKPIVKDSFLLLSLHLPQINYYRSLLSTSHTNHKLWILDSRIDDFPDLNKIWNADSLTFSVRHEDGQYEKDLKLADQYIQSVKPSEDIPFNIEETKKILSRVFLNGASWYNYQEPYLDLIIPGQTDELITLPTGGGKSLLFQAPALFRSAFTNKLTIVVTPLKALMEDQVFTLWEKGFYGSVEYLNSDRGSDVQLIYKAMAGGELALLFVTPERFRSRGFLNALNVRIHSDGGLEYFVFDEAHCVSQWGHEFRPDYFNCAKTISYLKKSSLNNTPLLLFSATVSQKIYEDFKRIFE